MTSVQLLASIAVLIAREGEDAKTLLAEAQSQTCWPSPLAPMISLEIELRRLMEAVGRADSGGEINANGVLCSTAEERERTAGYFNQTA